jgi:hypothetical protein
MALAQACSQEWQRTKDLFSAPEQLGSKRDGLESKVRKLVRNKASSQVHLQLNEVFAIE